MTRVWKISALVWLGLLSACTITGPTFTPLENVGSQRGVIYVYRPSNYDMGLMSALISLDGKPVASLENGGYVAVPVTPGEHTVTQKWKAGIVGNADLEGDTTAVVIDVKKFRCLVYQPHVQQRQSACKPIKRCQAALAAQ